jgi:excisionase family DNA binding protein
MRKRKEQPQPVAPQEEKVLDVTASMKGTLRFDDPVNLRINGKFDGTLDTKGKLKVGEKAHIKANITGEDITVAGYVEGNIKATTILRLDRSAKLFGDIETPRLSIEEGAELNGQLRMEKASASSSKPGLMTVSQVAEYLEVDSDKISEWVNKGQLPGTKDSGEWMFDRSKLDQWVSQGKIKA